LIVSNPISIPDLLELGEAEVKQRPEVRKERARNNSARIEAKG
jgi:hypothetical protein